MTELRELLTVLTRVLREANWHLASSCNRCGRAGCTACSITDEVAAALRAHRAWLAGGRAVVERLHDAVTLLHAYAREQSDETWIDIEAALGEVHFAYLAWREAVDEEAPPG